MCTTVVGGSIHRAATRISTASNQRSATPRRNHRTKDRREPFRSGVLESVAGFSVTLQNNRLKRISRSAHLSPFWLLPAAPRYRGTRRVSYEFRVRGAAFLVEMWNWARRLLVLYSACAPVYSLRET